MTARRSKIIVPRDLLLVEIERRCRDAHCNARTRVGLTKDEARLYSGFECEHCGKDWDDLLTERDVPEWWEELTISGLQTPADAQRQKPDEPSEVVKRMSGDYRR